ncbi:MAG: sulfite exporter TauE/SafE family protein [Alphaproteobacteria bacterium]|nr:sulfite exporter TauE/SafE family protein [Alphaproteobacteria bacterium]
MSGVILLVLILGLAGMAGFLAGLLGIGGGIVLVPGLYFIFTTLGYESAYLMHLAVGTSLATIIVTGFSSARAHWRRESVRFDLVQKIGIGMVIGVGLGTMIAAQASGTTLQILFAVILMMFAGLMQVRPEKISLFSGRPSDFVLGVAGTIIGAISTLMGIGGATLNVPFMSFCKVPIHKAVGTASALGVLIAIFGTAGFILIGWGNNAGFPPLSLGFVNLAAFAVIVPVSALTAPLGAAAAHRFSKEMLQRIFGLFMVFVAIKMLFEALRVLL